MTLYVKHFTLQNQIKNYQCLHTDLNCRYSVCALVKYQCFLSSQNAKDVLSDHAELLLQWLMKHLPTYNLMSLL